MVPRVSARRKLRRGGRPGNTNARTHGVHSLKHAVSTLGRRTIDRRTAVGRALAEWRESLLADLGGMEAVSTQELALVEEAVKTKLILDSVTAWLFAQPALVNKRAKAVLPAVRDRNSLIATLRSLLGDLGLKRRVTDLPGLAAFFAERAARATLEPPSPRSLPPRAQQIENPDREGQLVTVAEQP